MILKSTQTADSPIVSYNEENMLGASGNILNSISKNV